MEHVPEEGGTWRRPGKNRTYFEKSGNSEAPTTSGDPEDIVLSYPPLFGSKFKTGVVSVLGPEAESLKVEGNRTVLQSSRGSNDTMRPQDSDDH